MDSMWEPLSDEDMDSMGGKGGPEEKKKVE
jgi:hypothetical protein